MNNIFLTSDEHYDHKNIIKFCNRPFTSTWEMRDKLIANHNAKVGKNDVTYHLGDMFWRTLSLKECLDIRYALNGQHFYIWGNHEEAMKEEMLQKSFVWVKETANIKPRAQYPSLWLSHYAHRVWPGSHKGSWHVYGHSHAELPEKGLSFDVGVDATNFSPMSIDEIAEKMQKKVAAGVEHALADQMRKIDWKKLL